MSNGTEVQRGRWQLEEGPDGREEQVEDHSGREGHGRISPESQGLQK